MAIEVTREQDGKVLLVRLSGKLAKEDYERFVPEVVGPIQKYGKVRMLIEMRDFHGWSAGALWEDTKFTLKHTRDIERLAVVGEKRWQKGMATFCRPFTKADIQYFEAGKLDEARSWLLEEVAATK